MSLAEIKMKHLRGALLELLRDGTKAGDSTLTSAVQQLKGVQATRDQVKAALRWLEGQGYVSIESVGEYLVAQLRTAGLDYLEGRSADDGIQRALD